MTFLYPGDYIFEVSEIIPDEKDRDPRIDYDTHRETVVVRIKETEGALTATVLYDSDGPLFTNDLDGASAYITVHKILLGGEIQEGQFRFEMEEISRPIHARPTMVGKYTAVNSAVDEQEEVIDTYSGAISANPWIGTAPVRFDELIFITPGVYRYRISEIPGDDPMMRYASNAVVVTVTVVEEDGGLFVDSVSYSDSETNEENALFTNEVLEAPNAQATITVHKKLKGAAIEENEFSFLLKETGRPDGTEATISNGEVILTNGALDEREQVDGLENPWYDTAPIVYDRLRFYTAGTYTYELSELEKNGTVCDDKIVPVVVVVSEAEGALSADVSYPETEPIFVNSREPGMLKLTKTVPEAPESIAEQLFTFTLSLRDIEGNALTGEYAMTLFDGVSAEGVNHGAISDGGEIKLKAGQTVYITNLPHGTTYKLSEQELQGFELISAENAEGSITAKETSQVNFVNVYSATGSLIIPLEKKLEGGEITSRQFAFRMTGTDGTDKTVYIEPVEGQVNLGSAQFELAYSLADSGKTYTYSIVEIGNEADEEIIYDEHTEKLVVSLADNGQGVLEATPVFYSLNEYGYTVEDPEKDTLRFTNTVRKGVESFELQIMKRIYGNMGNKKDVFDFTIQFFDVDQAYDPDSVPDAWTKLEDGKYSFRLGHRKSTSVTLPFGITYVVTEAPQDYRSEINISVGSSTMENQAAAPTAKGQITDDTTVFFRNTRGVAIPTNVRRAASGFGLTVFGTGGLIALLEQRRRKKKAGAHSPGHLKA